MNGWKVKGDYYEHLENRKNQSKEKCVLQHLYSTHA